MSDAGDEDLAELIAREQRGFRRILAAGMATLIVMGLISAAMGAYLWVASASLAQTTLTLERQAFNTRRNVDTQNNRLVAQEIAIRRAYEEIRANAETAVVASPETIGAALGAARNFLLRGRTPSLAEQRALDELGPNGVGTLPAPTRALITGVAELVGYDARGESIAADAADLPLSLRQARTAFNAARADASLAPVANAGLAWILFEDASSQRKNYNLPACQAVFDAVDASAQQDAPSPQPLYWRAQCERKLGRTGDALGDYARALRASAQAATESSPDDSELTLAMNAYHGVGTTIIAGAHIPDDAPGMREALSIAGEVCPPKEKFADRSSRMGLALSCLDEAITLRRRLGQTPNQLSGTAENISFAYLRDGDLEGAYQNTVAVNRTGLFAWNETVRAVVSTRVRFDDENEQRAALAAAADARRNVSMFSVGQFNLCELKVLYEPDLYEAARTIIADTHPGEDATCPS